MKNKLLFTTALVAATFAAANVYAGDNDPIGVRVEVPGDNDERIQHVEDNTIIANHTITANGTSKPWGGAAIAIGASENQLTIGNNVCLGNNHSDLSGGSLLAMNGFTAGNNFTIKDSSSQKGGGAMYIALVDSKFNGETTSPTNRKVIIGNNSLFENNSSGWNLGAVAIESADEVTFGEGATFRNNKNGGVAVWTDPSGKLNGEAIKTGTTVNFNKALFEDNVGVKGAAIGNLEPSALSSLVNTINIANSTFRNNTATENGGAIYNAEGQVVNLTGHNIFENNKVNDVKNDIHNNGTLNVSGDLELDGGITGTGTVDFKEGSSIKVALSDKTTTPIVTAGTIKGTTSMILERGSTGGQIKFEGEQSKFKFADNALFNVEEEDGVYTFDKNSSSEIMASTGATAAQATALLAVTSGESDNATFNAIANNINSMLQSSNAGEVKAGLDAVTAMSPDVAPLVQKTSVETTNQVFNAVGTRLSGGSIRSASEGKASGDNIFERAAVWVQTLFNKSKLDDTSDAKGFDSDSTGVAFGAEKFVNDDVKVGVGYAFTNTDIDGFMRDTDVDTHTAIVYGEYKPSNWYVNGIANYNWSDYSEDKNVAGIGVKADYDVETFGLQTMTGYDMDVNGVNVTPEAGLRYFHVKQDSYKDSAGNKISSDDADILTGVIGAKVNKDFALENGMNIRPEARFAVTYDLMDADNSSFVTLANGAAYNVEGESLDRFGMEFGAGVTAEVNDNVELSLGYEGKFREDYQDHTGLLNAKYKF